jgi:thiol-disulfide isomerase/thioredoxin
MNRRLSLALVICVGVASPGFSSDGTGEPPNFFVAPLTTEVHRAVISQEATAYAVVHCTPLVAEDTLDLGPLDEPRFREELRAAAAGSEPHLRLVLRYELSATEEAGEPIRKAARARLEEIAREAGFRTVETTEQSTSAAWVESFAVVQEFEEADRGREPIVEDDFLRVYPLHTRLSKMVMGNAACVVEIKPPFDGRVDVIPEPLRESIEQAVRALELEGSGGVLQFRVTSTSAGQELVDRLFDSRRPPRVRADASPAIRELLARRAAEYQPSPGMELAMALGFEGITCWHSPGGGAPEKLIGQPAPTFSLQSLEPEGGELELRQFLAGRPALVTFWGVACGPCCAEAPHLTALHEKYGSEFAILAVNAYDETRETVVEYVTEAQLTHPIVLGGGSIARELYHVGSYPTTFWINREGIIDSYEVGFDSAEMVERRVVGMLGRD